MAKYSAQNTYDAVNVKHISLKLNKKTDADILEWLDRAGNKQGAIKEALKAYLKGENHGV